MIYHTIADYLKAKTIHEQTLTTIDDGKVIQHGISYNPKEFHAINTKPTYERPAKENPDFRRVVSGIIPRVKKAKIGLAIFLLILSFATKAQPFVQFAPTFTNQYLGGDLQVGLRAGKTFISTGYTAMIHNTQPALFNVRGGVILKDKILLYGGYVRNHQSNDYKWRNYNTWQAGAQYHFCFYDKGTFYTITNYTHPGRITVGVGMSYNLFR